MVWGAIEDRWGPAKEMSEGILGWLSVLAMVCWPVCFFHMLARKAQVDAEIRESDAAEGSEGGRRS